MKQVDDVTCVADAGRTIRYLGDNCAMEPKCDCLVEEAALDAVRCCAFDASLEIWTDQKPNARVRRCDGCRSKYGPAAAKPTLPEPRPGNIAEGDAGAPSRVETPHRRKLPDTRQSITHRFEVGGMHGYITVGLYPDGAPGEVFVKMAKEGSTLSGLLDGWAITTSIALQYGVPLIAIVHKLARTRFEPSGFTGVEGIGYASSVLDYIARWMAMRFLGDLRASLPPGEGPPCPNCGAAMVRGDGAWECVDCGQKMPG